jgi:hypothetical protein
VRLPRGVVRGGGGVAGCWASVLVAVPPCCVQRADRCQGDSGAPVVSGDEALAAGQGPVQWRFLATVSSVTSEVGHCGLWRP